MKRFAAYLAVFLTLQITYAGVVLFDFEPNSGKADVQALSDLESVAPTATLVPGGERAALLSFPAWKKGMSKKRWIELHRPSDWSDCKWLSMEVANPDYDAVTIHGFIADSNHRNIEDGMYFRINLGSYDSRRCVWRIKFKKGKEQDLKKINRIRLYTEKNKQPARIIVDNISIWPGQKPGEDSSGRLAKQMEKHQHDEMERLVSNALALAKEKKILPVFRSVMEREATAVRQEFRKSRAITDYMHYHDHFMSKAKRDKKTGQVSDKEKEKVIKRCKSRFKDNRLLPLHHAMNLHRSVERYQKTEKDIMQYQELGKPDTGYMVGFSTGMYKVMPKHLPIRINYTNAYKVETAQNERECFQLTVIPTKTDLKQVTVTASDLIGPDGAVLPRSAITCNLLGYTETRHRPGYGVDYVGWWPDPILPTQQAQAIAIGDAQTWWIRIVTPEKQAPGDYRGTLTVTGDGKSTTFDLNVHVWDFSVPKHTPIPTAVTTVHNNWESIETNNWCGGREGWIKSWRFRWADFLGDYYLTPDSLYRSPSPFPQTLGSVDFELMRYMKKKGTLGNFNLGLFYGGGMKDCLKYKGNYDKAVKYGLTDHIYLYGFDEQPSWAFKYIEMAAQNFEKLYPGVLQLTTTNDGQNGNSPAMPTLKGYCPINAGYNPPNAERARRFLGKYIWWYTCVWPPHPWPNFFLEYEPHDTRAFLGLLQIGNKPDGFLYYHTLIFGDNKGLDLADGAYTNWHPRSFGNTHGDGRWLYTTQKGAPISSMVLENYRDGLEDTAYYMILQHKLREMIRNRSGYVKLQRTGNRITAYSSGDGRRWRKVAQKEIAMGKDAYVGLAVSSHKKDTQANVVFDKVRVNNRFPSSLKGKDIGNVEAAGKTTYRNGRYHISGAGSDIWDRKDSFRYTYMKISGDCTIEARVKDLENYTHKWAKMGVMIRESLDDSSAFAFMSMVPGNDYGLKVALPKEAALQYRSQRGGEAAAEGSCPYDAWMGQAHDAIFNIKKYYWGLNDYTKDPDLLNEFRHKLAQLIESSPYKDDDPWKMHGWSAKGLKGITR